MIKRGHTIVKRNATNSELQRAIEAAIPQATKQAAAFADRYRGKDDVESCKKIFDYLKNNINYKADGLEQQVRLPSGLMRTAQGDCKSYSVFTSAVLSNLGIPHKLVYASYDPKDSTPSHIYVITDKGCIIDAVYGKFNAEKKATFKKYKKMNISYIAGVKPRKIGRSCNNGYSGIGAIRTGKQWAESLGIWNTIPNGVKANYFKNSVIPVPYIGGIFFIKALLRKNAGGFATSLSKLYDQAKADNSSDAFRKYRAIELEFLQKGGNPEELRQAFQEGATKTPTGQYFNKLMGMKARGYTPNIAQWIAAGVSLMFGKKYNETTGQITGDSTTIGADPGSAAALLANAPVWVQFVAYVTGTIGTAYVVAKVTGPNDIPGATPPPTGDTTDTTPTTPTNTGSRVLPLLLLGGAGIAAYYYLTKKK